MDRIAKTDGVTMNFKLRAEFWRGLALGLAVLLSTASFAADDPARGLDVLRTRCFLPADFDEEVLDELWTVWPEPEHGQAAGASPAERRRLTFSYYGLIPTPADTPGKLPALGYTANGQGGWVMNCLSCHGGKVAGRVIPGLPNSHLALQTLTEDVRMIKIKQKKRLTHLDLATLTLPLSTTNGTSNSVIFGVVLGAFRKPDMSVDIKRPIPPLVHHDVDPPPFWNVRHKSSLYADGFSPKTHRPLMQFMLIPSNSRETVMSWEDDFRDILAWIESLSAPAYPWSIDAELAAAGKRSFDTHCSRCHGTYGDDGRYVQQTIAWDEIRTDRLRLDALTPKHRQWMRDGWMSNYGADPVVTDPAGYVAPPLHGVWATAPYLHNGSVPTLWHVLHPSERPAVWKRTEDGYDTARAGLEVESFPDVPDSVAHPAHRRRYFDTKLPGKSSAGHDFPNALTAEEKRAVLEYLKSI